MAKWIEVTAVDRHGEERKVVVNTRRITMLAPSETGERTMAYIAGDRDGLLLDHTLDDLLERMHRPAS